MRQEFKEVILVIVFLAIFSIPVAVIFEELGISDLFFSWAIINISIDSLLVILAIDGYRSTTDFYRYV
jgi:hypothetical protein